MESVWRDIFLRAFVALGNASHHYTKTSLFDIHVCKSWLVEHTTTLTPRAKMNIPLRFCRYCQSVVVLCWKLCRAARYVCVSVKRTWSLGSAAKRRLGWVGRVHQWSKISLTDHPWFSKPGHPQRLNHASWFSSGAALHFYIWRYFYVWMLR